MGHGPRPAPAGVAVYIMVDDAQATLGKVTAHGGKVVQDIGAHHPEITALFRDPGATCSQSISRGTDASARLSLDGRLAVSFYGVRIMTGVMRPLYSATALPEIISAFGTEN